MEAERIPLTLPDVAILEVVKGKLWELRDAMVQADQAGLSIAIKFSGNFSDLPLILNDHWDSASVIGTRKV